MREITPPASRDITSNRTGEDSINARLVSLRAVSSILMNFERYYYTRRGGKFEHTRENSLPFLGKERVRLLGCGADSHAHFANGSFAYSALQNRHPKDRFTTFGCSYRRCCCCCCSARNDRRDDTLPITLRHGRVLRPSTTTRRTTHSIHVAIVMARLILHLLPPLPSLRDHAKKKTKRAQ